MIGLILAAAALISWTAPQQPVTSYSGQRSWNHGATWEALRLWQDEAFTVPYSPGTPGTTQHAYVWTDAPYRTDWLGRLVAVNAAGSSPASNRVIYTTGLPDTVVWLVRGYHPILPAGQAGVLQAVAWPHSGTQGFALTPGDSAAFTVETQEQVVRAMMVYICSINGGRYPMWGVQNVCP